jgi:hypothetical protein
MTAITHEEFDEGSFWDWMSGAANRLGKTLVEKVLVAYYVAIDPSTPAWAQASLIGALAYVGFPLDAIPDVIPVVGFTDDASILALALAGVVTSIRLRHVRSARGTMRHWGFKVQDVNGNDEDPGWNAA